jgi:hypothetical protein
MTPKKTPPQAKNASNAQTKDRIYLTNPFRKFYIYMIKNEITYEEAQALLISNSNKNILKYKP